MALTNPDKTDKSELDNAEPRSKTPAGSPVTNPWSYRIGTVGGIPIYLHVTFLLLLFFLVVRAFGQPNRAVAFGESAFVIGLFACVVLHELGHSLVARRYHIPVADITLYPIGGIARIEKQPTPAQELRIAIAGPAVNLVLFAAIAAITKAIGPFGLEPGVFLHHPDWLRRLAAVNLSLALFNMIPAFPMDGGRVLRALLGLRMPFDRATSVAAGVGQALALAAGLFAILSGWWMLLFIALFIFLGWR